MITGNTSQNNGPSNNHGVDMHDVWGDCVHNKCSRNTFNTKNPSCIQ